jgi:hypothetical protein
MGLVVAPGKSVSCKLETGPGVLLHEGDPIPDDAIVDEDRLERLGLAVPEDEYAELTAPPEPDDGVYGKLRKPELQILAKARGLDDSGTVKDLAVRLEESDAAQLAAVVGGEDTAGAEEAPSPPPPPDGPSGPDPETAAGDAGSPGGDGGDGEKPVDYSELTKPELEKVAAGRKLEVKGTGAKGNVTAQDLRDALSAHDKS